MPKKPNKIEATAQRLKKNEKNAHNLPLTEISDELTI